MKYLRLFGLTLGIVALLVVGFVVPELSSTGDHRPASHSGRGQIVFAYRAVNNNGLHTPADDNGNSLNNADDNGNNNNGNSLNTADDNGNSLNDADDNGNNNGNSLNSADDNGNNNGNSTARTIPT